MQFWACALLALGVHAALLLRTAELRGGADLVPHLRLIQWMAESPALRSVYAPAYHIVGAALDPLVGLDAYPKLFAFGSAVALIFGFRFFQRAAALPDAASAVFALSPYAFSLSYCLPKVEFAGHAVGLFGLGLLIRKQYVGVALAVLAAFWVHTAAALVFGFAATVWALVARDVRGLLALAAGALLALPLFAVHVADGCSVAEALLFSRSGYLGSAAAPLVGPRGVEWLAAQAGPFAVVAAAFGAPALWRWNRRIAVLALALVALYLNDLWLAPFGLRTTGGLQRGLSVLAIPVAVSAGCCLAGRRRLAPLVLGACALYAVAAAVAIVPRSCMVRPIARGEIEALRVERCMFVWGGPNVQRTAPRRGPEVPARRAPAPVERPGSGR